ncbi:hypothetical protein PVAP13_5NG217880 [Panicum virgatum]|uniref:CHY-type domain-containing protein n=1 Tax=Panicum virgatum TaxID=38727 RepID=A0A8T0RY59_PANVG|nr:hypothetical protein PVAP13_5NG217880 [Panicum virgatum]
MGGAHFPGDNGAAEVDAACVGEVDRRNVGKMEHGCEHYRRRCKIVACNQVLPCRHCHNEATLQDHWSRLVTTNKLDIRLTSACSYRVTLEQIGEKKMLDIRLHYARHLNKQSDHGHWRRLVRTNKLSVRLHYGRHPSKQSDHGEV